MTPPRQQHGVNSGGPDHLAGAARARLSAALAVPILAILVLLTLPGAARAQTIDLRSGEHGEFTRLVLYPPEDLGWTGALAADGASYRLELERGGFDMALEAVFRRIGRDRVAAVTALPGGQGIEVALACDCVVEAFAQSGRMIVLDVRARPSGTAQSGAPPADTVGSQAAAHPGPGLATARAAQEGLPDLGLRPGLLDVSGARALLPTFDPGARLASQSSATPEERAIAEDFGRALAEQLARGATEGLLDADGPVPPPDPGHGSEHGQDQRPDSANLQAPGQESASSADQSGVPLSAEMLEGRVSQGYGASSVLRIGGQAACFEDRRLDIPGWFGSGGEAAAVARLGDLRGRLVGEFDRIDPRVQRDLAQLYISLGFGAEARALLQLDPEIPDPLLMTLATLTDGGSDPAGVFAGQSECRGRSALWAVLGARSLPRTAEIAVLAILAAFEELPLALRRSLGPRLAQRLVEEGQADTARNVLSRLSRALGRDTEAMQLASARVARADGAPDEASALLGGLISAPGELGVAAAVESIDLATSEGLAVAPEMIELTGAYSTERRSTDDRDAIWLAHVRAAWANAEFDRAFAEIDAPGAQSPETRIRARTETMRALAESGGDGKFLRRALDVQNLALAPTDPRLALQVAARLLDLGLPEAAGRWLAGPAPPGRDHDWRLLEARMALAQQRPEAAEIALVGLQGEEVLRLRAAAREAMGDYEFAREAHADLGDAENAARLAWLAGDLEATATGGDPVLAGAAAIARAEEAAPGTGAAQGPATPSLAEGAALADSGQKTIDAIRALLADSAIPGL